MARPLSTRTPIIVDAPLAIDRAERLEKIEQLTTFLDEAIRIPGTNFRVGWDAVIGLIPGIGDAVSAALAAHIVHEASKLGVSKWTLARMIANVGIDAVVGLVPVVGDLFDMGFKANRRNVRLLRKRLEAEARRR
jgi:hypothetical protein